MKLVRTQEQGCTFRVNSRSAQQVKLVMDAGTGSTQIYPLRRVGALRWELQLQLSPGTYRFCYHLYDGRSLHYLTPPGHELDGLKAVLHIGAGEGAPSAGEASGEARPQVVIPAAQMEEAGPAPMHRLMLHSA